MNNFAECVLTILHLYHLTFLGVLYWSLISELLGVFVASALSRNLLNFCKITVALLETSSGVLLMGRKEYKKNQTNKQKLPALPQPSQLH